MQRVERQVNVQAKNPGAAATAVIPHRFQGKVAIVTGGASGMGRAQAIRLAAEGASVAILDINAQAGAVTSKEIGEKGGDAVFLHADLTNPDAIDAALETVAARFGPADLLFNNAGAILVKAYTETTEDEFDWLVNANVRSAFMVTRRVIPQMLANGGGSIVIMSSVSAARGFPLEAIYGMTKSAVQALTINIAIEYREQGIRCNAICPAFVRTAHGLREIDDFKTLGIEWDDDALAATQLRICEPEDVASVALYLASDEAGFLNGVAIPVDNGWMAKA